VEHVRHDHGKYLKLLSDGGTVVGAVLVEPVCADGHRDEVVAAVQGQLPVTACAHLLIPQDIVDVPAPVRRPTEDRHTHAGVRTPRRHAKTP
ncbi:MAG: hypothetical protein FWD11_05025, partial [Micrococcales bacterium]|nr:hypothetical protein [Micrococcales bacterium]